MHNRGLVGMGGFTLAVCLCIAIIVLGGMIKPTTTGYDIFPLGAPACGTTLTDNTTLDGNVGPCAGDGLVIGAENLTLDCAGYTITGPGGTGNGIFSNQTNVTIKNCEITEFEYGIFSNYTSNNTITNNTANNNVFGIRSRGNNDDFFYNTANNNTDTGITVTGNYTTISSNIANNNLNGITIGRLSYFNNVTNNTANNNYYDSGVGDGGIGISDAGFNNTITNNTANNNSFGFVLGENDIVTNNTATNNYFSSDMGDGGYGFFSYDTDNVNLSFNRADSNTNYGLYLTTNSDYNSLINNTARLNGDTGIYLIDMSINNTIVDNTACGNSVNDFYFSVDSVNNSGDNICETSKINDEDFNSVTCSRSCPQVVSDCMNITTSGTWTLTQDLSENQSSGICIDVQAPDVIIDCAGFSISGTDSYETYGIYTNRSNTTIENCYVQDYMIGVELYASNYSNLTNNTLDSDFSNGVRLQYSSDNHLFNNTFSNNFEGIKLSWSHNNIITNNMANDNVECGIYIQSLSSNNTVSNNTAFNNEYGIGLDSYSYNISVFDNIVYDNTYGISFMESTYNSIFNNTVNNNTDTGIYLETSSNNTLVDNTVCYNSVDAFYFVSDSENNTGDNICDSGEITDEDSNVPAFSCSRPCPFLQGTCGQTITENVTLTQDLSCSGTDGITIGADGITLDCDGHTLIDSGTDQGIYNDGFDDVSVKNCVIIDFETAIFFTNNADNGIILNNTLNNNDGAGITIDTCNNTMISYNKAKDNPECIGIGFSNYSTLTYNTLNDSDAGIMMSDSTNNTIAHNIAHNHSGSGFILNTNHSHIFNNTILNNMEYGIELTDGYNNTITNNTANNNLYGIYFSADENNNTLINNTANNNYYDDAVGDGGIGIFVSADGQNNTLINNIANNNSYGLYISANQTTLINNTANNNYYSSDLDDGGYGIYVDGSSFGGMQNNFINNTANNNEYYGFYLIYSSFNTITNNTASGNEEIGIRLTSSQNNNLTYNNVSYNLQGINLFLSSDYNRITNNTASGNEEIGIYLDSSSNNTIINNTATNNIYHSGIFLGGYSDNNTVSDNIFDNNDMGIYLASSNFNTFINNMANYNHPGLNGDGIILDTSNNNTFINNTINNSARNGIWIGLSDNNTFGNNSIKSNTKGVYIELPSINNMFTDNAFCYNNVSFAGVWTGVNTVDNNTFCIDLLSGPANDSSITTFPSSIDVNISNPIFDTECRLSVDGTQYASVPVTAPDTLNNKLTTFTLGTVPLRQGNHNYTVYCNDSGGSNTGNAVVQFTVPGAAPTPPSPGGGDFPPEEPAPVPPVTPTPTEAPETWPDQIPIPTPGSVITIPSSGTSILLMRNMTNNVPDEGAVAIILYPGTTGQAVINNISTFTPEKLRCNQKPLASHEINITAEVINYCMNVKGASVNESTISVWKLSQDEWQELPSGQIIRDTDIICGNITSAMTPYMIAGFTPVIGVSEDVALAAIRDAEAAISQALAEGKAVGEAERLLEQAKTAYASCDYGSANELANNASSLALGIPVIPLAALFLLLVALIIAGITYWYIKKRVKPKAIRRHK